MFLQALAEGIAKGEQAERREDAEQDRNGLPQPDRTGNCRTTQDGGGEQAELNAPRFAVLNAVASEKVCESQR